MEFKKAIVRKPSRSISEGLSSVERVPDFKRSLSQHEKYVGSLKEAGLDVLVIESEEEYPDSVFVEDTAVLMEELAVICNLGVSSRRGEERSIVGHIESFYDNIDKIYPPGTLEGGDVMKVEDNFFIGLSKRTNKNGIEQFRDIVDRHGYSVTSIKMNEMLHLKTGVAYLGDDILVTSGEMKEKHAFEKFEKVEVPDEEMYAANCICVNGNVILPEGYPRTERMIEEKGFRTIDLDLSEFKKLDGGVSCLSLRF